MRYAIFSDIHANRQAWKAVLADMEALEVQVYVCLGDIVGYGPCPQEVLDSIRNRTRNIVVGNHDAAAAGLMDSAVFNPVARDAIEWTRENLDEESRAFLSHLPLAVESGEIFCVHAEVADPAQFGYIDDAETARENFAAGTHRVTFVGHTHFPALFRQEEDGSVEILPDEDCTLDASHRYLVNVGSVGEPRAYDDIRARYVIYDADTGRLYFRRIEFDAESYRADLEATGLELYPFFLAVIDHQESAETTADRAMAEGGGISIATDHDIEELVLPDDLDPELSSHEMPVPAPTPALPTTRRTLLLAASPLLAVVVAVTLGVGILLYLRGRGSDPEEARVDEDPPVIQLTDLIPNDPVTAPAPAPAPAPEPAAAPATPAPAPAPAPAPPAPAIAVVPGPAPAPMPAPKPPEPAPAPDGPPPLPEMIGLKEGLIFYVPFDVKVGGTLARDLSGEGRDLSLSTVRTGHPGQVGLACKLDPLFGELVSEPKFLAAGLRNLTVSFWLKRPAKPEADPNEVAKPDPPGNLVSLRDFFDLRIENGQVVANLDRTGEVARMALPMDDKWHHVLVTNDRGITGIWIDNTASDPVAETLKRVPNTEVPVVIGSAESNFFIDEVAIWDRAFSASQRRILHQRNVLRVPVLIPVATVAHWGFDAATGSKYLRDESGIHPLELLKPWRPVGGAAPRTIPLTLKPNPAAGRVLHLVGRPEQAGLFRLTSEAAFTYEGWLKFDGGSGGTLGGTVSESDEEGTPGWRVAVRRSRGANGFLGFIYETGSGKIQALSKELPLFNGLAHHFAAVWDPAESETQGKLTLFVENQEVATASLSHSDLRPDAQEPFRIEVLRTPVTLDEVRFSAAALPPELFLTAGLPTRPADDSNFRRESGRDRRERELAEKKFEQLAEKMREEATKKMEDEEKARQKEEEKKRREMDRKS